MNKKLFLFVLILSASLQSGLIFGGEKPTMGWWEYLTGGWRGHTAGQQNEGETSEAYGARRAEVARQQLASTLARQIQLKLYKKPKPVSVVGETMHERSAKSVARDVYGSVAKTAMIFSASAALAAAIAYLASGKISNYTFHFAGGSSFRVEGNEGFVSTLSKTLLDEPLEYLVGPSFICSLIINAIYAQLGQGYIAEDSAVSLVKSTIVQMLGNSMDFPTRSSKIRMLLKRNEWYIPLQGSGYSEQQIAEIMDRACSQLSEEIWNVKISDEQKKKDKEIDGLMQKIRMRLQGKSLDEQINTLQAEIEQKQGNLIQLLDDSDVKATYAVLSSLARQKLVEAAEAESLAQQRAKATKESLIEESPEWPQSTFEKTSAAKQFYRPIPDEKQKEIEQRKKMDKNEWKKYREAKRAAEEATRAAKPAVDFTE